ncbi:hypothetical protein ACTFIR_003962 [Dictyostelium discoideum]
MIASLCRFEIFTFLSKNFYSSNNYDFPVNKDSLYTLNSFYNQNIVTQLYQQSQQHNVHKNINKLKEYVKNLYDELFYTIKFDKETNKPIISLLHSTGTSDTSLIPTLKCLIVSNKENMDKPKIIINSHSKEEQLKLILDTGSNVSLINKRLISKEMKNHVHKTKAKINFPLLDVKEEFVEQINIQVNNEIHTFFIIELDIIDVLFGNNILKDSIINQKDKIIKFNNSTYKINYQQSNHLHCNVKSLRKHVTVSNDSKSDKLPDIADYINNSRRGNIIHNIIIKKDQDVEPTMKQIYYSTDDHKRNIKEMVLKFID